MTKLDFSIHGKSLNGKVQFSHLDVIKGRCKPFSGWYIYGIHSENTWALVYTRHRAKYQWQFQLFPIRKWYYWNTTKISLHAVISLEKATNIHAVFFWDRNSFVCVCERFASLMIDALFESFTYFFYRWEWDSARHYYASEHTYTRQNGDMGSIWQIDVDLVASECKYGAIFFIHHLSPFVRNALMKNEPVWLLKSSTL